MATIFLSYRRTDSPQACRVYDWLGQRFGYDAVFMDVAAIPFAVQYPDFIKESIARSRVMIALIGDQWTSRINDENDPVRKELEAAVANDIPVLPVLIGTASMPGVDALPESIAAIAAQNAYSVGVLLDFHSHMQMLLPEIESILGRLAKTSTGHSNPYLNTQVCQGVMSYLRTQVGESVPDFFADWMVVGAVGIRMMPQHAVTLYLHRVKRLAELIELHFLLSFWADAADMEQTGAEAVMIQIEHSPIVPDEFFGPDWKKNNCNLRIRWSDEDPRQVWKMITDEPLRFSLACVATISPKAMGTEVPTIDAVDQGPHPA